MIYNHETNTKYTFIHTLEDFFNLYRSLVLNMAIIFNRNLSQNRLLEIFSVVHKHLDSQSAAFALRAHAGQIVDLEMAQHLNSCMLLNCVPVCMSGYA